MTTEVYILIAGSTVMLITWLMAMKFIPKLTGMTKDLPDGIGVPKDESGWGTAYVNGPKFSGCVKLVVFDNGFVVRAMPIFGGMKLWLPADSIKILSQKMDGRSILPRYIEFSSHGNYIKLYDGLADCFHKHYEFQQ
ncbi:hypothetical protein ABMA57_16325 [Saccharospirillum sp. HFRX-1]|uniref:hypothetical protein n=1 Tax=unclassified Saccharospirillum TaxID=2633430 RepID=UPI00371824F7